MAWAEGEGQILPLRGGPREYVLYEKDKEQWAYEGE